MPALAQKKQPMKLFTQLIIFLFLCSHAVGQTVELQREADLDPELYSISGIGFLEELDNGELQFRLSDDFDTPAGPDVRVLLNTSISGSGGVELVNLSTIGHFSGALTVPVPSGIDIEDYDFVVFFCVAFNQLWASGEFGDTIDLTGGGAECESSSVENQNGNNEIDICPLDNNSDEIFFENSLGLSAGSEYVYLITDEDEILLEVVEEDSYDFEGSDLEEQRVYGLHYAGSLDAEIGSDRMQTTASDCFEHSDDQDFITITKNACPNCEESEVSIIGGASSIDICPSDNSSDLVIFENSLNITNEDEYVYLITDENEILQELVFDQFFDFEGTSEDVQRVYGMHYEGTIDVAFGSDRFATTASGCFEHSDDSDFITITKNACIPEFECLSSGISSNEGLSYDICPTDGSSDELVFTNTLDLDPGVNYAYLITDENEFLQEVILDDTFDFEGSDLNTQRVYGMHYDGTINSAVGMHRSATTASGCFEHSNAIDFVEITKNACIPEFECLANEVSSNNGLNYSFCTTDGQSDVVALSNSLGLPAGTNYAYLVTDVNEMLLAVVLSDVYDFEGSTLDAQRVYGIHYDGVLNPQIGQNRTQTTASNCFTHSNSNVFISILNDDCAPIFNCIASTVNSGGQTSLSICANDGVSDIVPLNNSINAAPGMHYAYLITDANDVVVDVSLNSQYDFEVGNEEARRVHGIHFDGDLQPQIGQNRMMTTATGCFTHSSAANFLSITTSDCVDPVQCFSSSISTTTGTNAFNFCTEDGMADVIALTNTTPSVAEGQFAYLITDENEILQDIFLNPTINFEGTGNTTQRIYGIHYEGSLNSNIGMHRLETTATECFEHSTVDGFVLIEKSACPPPFECQANFTFTAQQQGVVTICPNDGEADLISIQNNLNEVPGLNYAYLITDVNDILLEVTTASVIDFEGSSLDQQRVHGIHFDGDLISFVGQSRLNTMATGCFVHSDATQFLTISKDGCASLFECRESLTATTDWATSVDICPSDGMDDLVALRNNLFIEPGDNYAYLITDRDGILQEVTLDSIYNFEGSVLDEQRVYGVHYDGTLMPVIGAHRTETTATGCFTHSGDNLFLTVSKTACVSTFECAENLTATTDWMTNVEVCPTDGSDDWIELRNNLFIEPGDHYAYLITDSDGIVQEVTVDSLYNFEGSGLEEQRVYGIHFDGTLMPVIGEHRTETTATGCFMHSGDNLFLTISKVDCEPSTYECVESLTATFAWVTEVDICSTDGTDDFILLQNNIGVAPGENYAFLITDEFEVLQEVVMDSLYNFNNTGTAEQRVYGISYDGILDAKIGETRKNTTASNCFVHSGDNLFLTINKTTACLTSTEDLENQTEINVYPNPSEGVVNIDYDRSEVAFEKLNIYNHSGQVVQSVEGNENMNSVSIENPGVYILRFENRSETVIKKVVIQ